jgi:hypothetical protein
MSEIRYLLFDLEQTDEGDTCFQLACNRDLHTLIQDVLPVEAAYILEEPYADMQSVIYLVEPIKAEYVYSLVSLIADDYFEGIRLCGAWWAFIESGL